ncbi:MAG: hypothetical protein JW751_16630 [Polyangiaceae bacterium]|nr:hypothetical protein [Polyangiaceae bacterium]
MRWATVCAVFGAAVLFGCKSIPVPEAFENRVFYEYGDISAQQLAEYERPYPPLDHDQEPPSVSFIGVQVLGGTVRFSRPTSWVIRNASNEPAKRFIEYVSPSQLVFTISEQVESPEEPWSFILDRYQAAAEKAGAKIESEPFPNATWNAQARGFRVRRYVRAPKAPFETACLEYIVRSDNRVLLVQIVHQDQTVKPVQDEVMRAFTSMQVL